jgi:hypothetical protein
MADYLRLVLERDGHGVAAAFNAEDAWAPFQRQVPRVRTVVTDLRMPGGSDGLGSARRVHRSAPNTAGAAGDRLRSPGAFGPALQPFSKTLQRRCVAGRRALGGQGQRPSVRRPWP